MRTARRLALRREALADLTAADLGGVAAGRDRSHDTCASCLTYQSCHLTDCLFGETRRLDCVQFETVTC
jgi:hypothetical protein